MAASIAPTSMPRSRASSSLRSRWRPSSPISRSVRGTGRFSEAQLLFRGTEVVRGGQRRERGQQQVRSLPKACKPAIDERPICSRSVGEIFGRTAPVALPRPPQDMGDGGCVLHLGCCPHSGQAHNATVMAHMNSLLAEYFPPPVGALFRTNSSGRCLSESPRRTASHALGRAGLGIEINWEVVNAHRIQPA